MSSTGGGIVVHPLTVIHNSLTITGSPEDLQALADSTSDKDLAAEIVSKLDANDAPADLPTE